MTKELSFHSAYLAMQSGQMIARKAWDKGCFIFAQVPNLISKEAIPKMTSLPESVKAELVRRGLGLNYYNQIAFVDDRSNIHGYNPSISDLNADDWYIL